jgi:membrane-associated phospholipid phosphatase
MRSRFSLIADRRWRHALAAVGLSVGTFGPTVAAAQIVVPKTAADSAAVRTRLFNYKDVLLAGAFAGTALLMTPLDRHLAVRLQDSSTQSNRLLKKTTTGFEYIASPGAYVIGGALYAVGKIGHYQRLADLGWHGTESVFLAEGITYVVKGIAGRKRPYISNGTDADFFAFGRGFKSGDYASFPSGHTSTAFAAASAVTSETSRWWPNSTKIIGPLMYGGATAVGLSRMYHSKHWASDVVIGAAIGTFSGRKVDQYAHDNPRNRLDRIILSTSLIPDGHGGGMLAYSMTIP